MVKTTGKVKNKGTQSVDSYKRPAFLFTSILILFLIVAFFLVPSLTEDQRYTMLFLFSILAGLSTHYLGGEAFFQINGETPNGWRVLFSATAGIAVFALCYLFPPYFFKGGQSNPLVQPPIAPNIEESQPFKPNDSGFKMLTTMLSSEVLKNPTIPNGDENQELLRSIIKKHFRAAVINLPVDAHHQSLVSLFGKFEHNYKSCIMNFTIRNEIELRDIDAYLVKFESGRGTPTLRPMSKKLPENKNFTGIINLDQPRQGEFLLLILRVGTDSDDIDLNKTLAEYYMLSGTPE